MSNFMRWSVSLTFSFALFDFFRRARRFDCFGFGFFRFRLFGGSETLDERQGESDAQEDGNEFPQPSVFSQVVGDHLSQIIAEIIIKLK